MKKIMVGVAVALALGASTAAADGIDKRPSSIAAPVPVYAPTWSGFYIGAGIGHASVVHDVTVDNVLVDRRLFDFNGGDQGVFGTVIIGWDWQIGRSWVFGVFGDYDFTDRSTRHSLGEAFDNQFNHQTNHDSVWSVGARLGWLSSPSALWYVTGGYTQAEHEHSFARSGISLGVEGSRDRSLDGFFVGAGVDTRLATSNWFLRLEYRFSDFDSDNLGLTDQFGRDLFDIETDSEIHSARLTLTYKFGGWGSGFGNWGKY